jgi:tetratricopeptide (TPR) repeat protein
MIRITNIYSLLGSIYADKGDYDQALQANTKAVAVAQAVLGKQHPLVSKYWADLGSVYRKKGEPQQALLCYTLILHI